MNELKQAESKRVIRIGPDRVTVTEDEVVIEARREMPDWEVREFKVVPIYFEDKKHYLIEKRKAAKPYAVRYVLLPWVDGKFDAATFVHNYDAEAVADRDAQNRSEKSTEIGHAFLVPLYPLLGFLWSGTQRKLARLDFIPRTITSVSIWVGFLVAFCEVVFLAISIQASARSGQMLIGGVLKLFLPWSAIVLGPVHIPINYLDIVIFVTCLVDATMRLTYASRDDQWHGGFGEWIFRKSLRAQI